MATKTTKYVVGDQGYLLKDGKVYQTGAEIELTADEHKNVKDKVVSVSSDEGKALLEQNQKEEDQENK